MKGHISRLCLMVLSVLALHNARADEGMWTVHNLPDAIYRQMQAEGFQMPKGAIYDDSLSLKDCVVSFSGYCTGEVVSPLGLVLTNHHCGFEAIRAHSTVEHDYMLHGFVADSLQAELPNRNLYVAFMKGQRDVTALLDSLGLQTLDSYGRTMMIDSLAEVLTAEARQTDSTYYVEIDPFYEGNAYYATTYQRYPDVRLVFAVPKSMGKFGGDTDNWMWPRQTCDISVFRIYVDPVTGGPAEYSPDNVPMRPKRWLPVSTNGYADGDFAMVMGYPGSTQRYLSSYGIEEMRDCVNDPMQQVRGVKQAVMRRHMEASEAVRILYDSKYAQSSNYWKNAIGMNKCIDSLGIVNQKRTYEERIRQWAAMHRDEAPAGLDLDRLAALYAARREAMRTFTLFAETFTRRSNNELAIRATKYFNGMPVYGPEKRARRQYVMFDDNSATWDRELDTEALAAMMQNYREQAPAKYLPSFYNIVDSRFGGSCRDYVENVWATSILMRPGAHIPVRVTRSMKRDLGIDMSMALVETLADIKLVLDSIADSISTQERLLCQAKLRMEQEMPHYSDANLTMRLSYGQVGGYRMAGYDSGYYTTAMSMLEKIARSNSVSDYKAEPELTALLAADDFGEYTDSVSGTLNLCFLTNNDITGGNSGSPVIDARGRLIGLAFDGTWESLSSDIYYDSTLARCISVDIRYVLYLMKHWGKATRLIDEMTGRQ